MKYKLPGITLSVRTPDGFEQKIVKVEGFIASVICPICRTTFTRKRDRVAAKLRKGTIQYCSTSCRTKGLFQYQPELREKASRTMHKLRKGWVPWNLGLTYSDERRAAMSKQAKEQGRKPKVQGGNGRGMAPTEVLIAPLLPKGFTWNYPVSLKGAGPGYPSHYKLDFAHPERKICLEVDGASHGTVLGKKRDSKKTKKLESLGWKVVRIRNKDAWSLYSTSKLKKQIHTLLTDS